MYKTAETVLATLLECGAAYHFCVSPALDYEARCPGALCYTCALGSIRDRSVAQDWLVRECSSFFVMSNDRVFDICLRSFGDDLLKAVQRSSGSTVSVKYRPVDSSVELLVGFHNTSEVLECLICKKVSLVSLYFL